MIAAASEPSTGLPLWIWAALSIVGAITTVASIVLARRSSREANENQHEAVESKKKLDEVDALRGVIHTLTEEVGRVNQELDVAGGKVDRLNHELGVAQRNVRVLIRSMEAAGVPIPRLEAMHDVN